MRGVLELYMYLEKNEFVKEDSTSNVGDSDAEHDYDRPNHVALSPCFNDKCVWIRRFGDFNHSPVEGVRDNGCHDRSCYFVSI